MKQNNFSHIYIEDDSRDYPLTEQVLKRFSKATVIPIRSYKDVFNRPQQEWLSQKRSQKLILAKKRSDYLYPGSSIAANFGHAHFFYNTLLLNCIYDCSYCYLQGMYPSANIVLFVNQEDFMQAVQAKLQTLQSLYVCISYDTDLLGFENLFQLNAAWIALAANEKKLTIESRTKSANFGAISHLTPTENFILAWTVSPEYIRQNFEALTPSLTKKLQAINRALALGWTVRLCLDPIVQVPDWQKIYGEFIRTIAAEIDLHAIKDFSVGVFRMNQDFLKRIKKQERPAPLLYETYHYQDGVASYEQDVEHSLQSFVAEQLQCQGISTDKIICW